MSTVTIEVIAQEAGVSPATVSRVFNRRPYVKENLSRRVLAAARRLDYRPPVVARRRTVSMVMAGKNITRNSYEASMLGSFFYAASQLDFNIEFVPLQKLDQVYRNFSEATIAMIYGEAAADSLRQITEMPVITINYQTAGCHYVCTDHRGGAFQGTECLIRHGHRRIGILLSPFEDNMSWGEKARFNGYREALAAFDCEFDPNLVFYGTVSRIKELPEMLQKHKPTALLVCGESLVVPVWHQLLHSGYRIPEDLSLVTYYHPSVTPFLYPEPTCLVQEYDHITRLTMENLQGLLTGECQKLELIIDHSFLAGQSVRQINPQT